VKARDKKCLAELAEYIRNRKTSERVKLDIYSYLLQTRGKGCADHAMVLIRLYSNSTDHADIDSECTSLFADHPVLQKPGASWPARICMWSFIAILAVIVALIVLAAAGRTIPTDQRYLVSLLVSMLMLAFVGAGMGTAAMTAHLPQGPAKAVIKFGGPPAAFMGTFIIMHYMGF
jgi:hypothetical protein